jgi:hypothetical protein
MVGDWRNMEKEEEGKSRQICHKWSLPWWDFSINVTFVAPHDAMYHDGAEQWTLRDVNQSPSSVGT